MTVLYAVELIAMLAFGLGYARWQMAAIRDFGVLSGQSWASWLEDSASGFFAGAAVVACLGLWAERMSRRDGNRPWGFGRLALAITGLYLGFRYLAYFLYDLIYHIRKHLPLGAMIEDLPADFRNNFASGQLNVLPFVLLAIVAARRGGVRPSLPAADAREWFGRFFAGSLIASGLAFHAASAAGF